MVERYRKRIGLLINNDDVGVVYYLLNLAKSLNELEDFQKPTLVFLFTKYTMKHIELFKFYAYREIVEANVNLPLEVYIKDFFRSKNYFESLSDKYELHGLFPVLDTPRRIHNENLRLVSWVTDFQHKVYPQNFTLLNRILREFRFRRVLKNIDTIVLSSQDSHRTLNQYYSNYNAKIKILNFVSLAQTKLVDIQGILSKYDIKKPFFVISNQFYIHKNHGIVFDAIKILKESGKNEFEFIFTGKTEDYRNPEYYGNLMRKVEGMNISGSYKILGLIPREEQLLLMQNAEAIIQPSSFEGWNTSIEDAKNIGQVVICSDIEVHKEQLQEYGYFFEKDSARSLVECIETYSKDKLRGSTLKYPDDKALRKLKFAEGFLSLFETPKL